MRGGGGAVAGMAGHPKHVKILGTYKASPCHELLPGDPKWEEAAHVAPIADLLISHLKYQVLSFRSFENLFLCQLCILKQNKAASLKLKLPPTPGLCPAPSSKEGVMKMMLSPRTLIRSAGCGISCCSRTRHLESPPQPRDGGQRHSVPAARQPSPWPPLFIFMSVIFTNIYSIASKCTSSKIWEG